MSERTLFYSKDLTGQGTGQVQSLRSYIEHLAVAHNMRPLALLKTLFEKFPSTLVSPAAVGTLMSLKLHNGSAIADEVQQRLELATDCSLRGATLGNYAEIFAPSGLTHRGKLVYCPRCVCEGEGLPYMRLLWDVECVRACPVHGVKLRSFRPIASCGASDPEKLPLQQRPSLGGVCHSCGSVGYRCVSTPADEASDEEVLIAQQVERLLAVPHDSVAAFTRETVRAGINLLVQNVHEGSVVRASTAAGLSRASVSTWARGARPGLPWLLQLCLHSGADIVALVGGAFSPLSEIRGAGQHYTVLPRRYQRAQTSSAEIQKLLRNATTESEPPSLRDFARRHGVHFDVVRHQFPAEVARLSKLRKAHLGRLHDTLRAEALEVYTRAASSLQARGETVHRRTLQQESGLMAMNRTGYRFGLMQSVLAGIGQGAPGTAG